MTILETPRLILRHLVPSDLNDLYSLYSDPEIRHYFPDGVRTYDETKEELEWFLDGHPRHPELGLWATIHKESGQFIGRCGLLPWTIDGVDEVEIAYMIGKPWWRQGLGTEVARALVMFGFEQRNQSRLIALIDPEHQASIRTAESAGLRFERTIELDDGFPTVLYSISRG